MNYLVSVLFVLACINFTTQENATAVNKTFNANIDINGTPAPIPDTVHIIPIQPNITTTSIPPPPPTNATTTSTTTTSTTATTPITTTKTTTSKPTTKSTTVTPITKPTTHPPAPSPNTTVTPATSSVSPVTTEKPVPEPHRRFDGPSFIGGIVLALGLVAIGFVAFKFYKARLEVNYHTL